MTELGVTILDATLVSSAIAALLIVLRRPMLKLIGPEWTYATWLLPVLPAIPMRLPELPSVDPAGVLRGSSDAVYVVQAQLTEQVASGLDLGMIAITLWAVGAGVMFVWGVARYAYLVQLLRDARWVGEWDGLVVRTAPVPVPLTIGLLRPAIIVPAQLWEETDQQGREHILAHEAVHAHRRDVLWNLIGFSLLCLHWFNPIAWAAYAVMRRDQELSCDACVTGSSSTDDRARYARLLVEVVAAQPATAAPAMAADFERLEERIRMIWKHRTRPAVTRTAMVGLVAVGVAMTGLRAGATDPEEPAHEDHDVRVDVRVRADFEDVAHDDDMVFEGDDGRVIRVEVAASDDAEAHAEGTRVMTWVSEDGSEHETHDVMVTADGEGDFEYAFGDGEESVERAMAMVRERGGNAYFGPGVRLEVSIQRGELLTQPTIALPYGAEGSIELHDEDSGAYPLSLALEVSEAATGTAQVDWTVREEYAGTWSDVASGSQHVTLGELTELVTGLPGTTITLTANDSGPHLD